MSEPDQHIIETIARNQPPFGELLGVRIVSASPDEVIVEIDVTEELGNRNGVLHGGALMGLADNAGGTATFLNLKPGEATTTLESKTNFFRPIPLGEVARATCRPLHKGRKTMVWQTTVTLATGKVAAVVTQTQMILPPEA